MHEKLLVFALSAGDAKKRHLRQALAIKGGTQIPWIDVIDGAATCGREMP